MRLGWLTIALLTGCTDDPSGLPMALYNVDGGDLFDAPWPSDARMDGDGTVDVSLFPNPQDKVIIENYLELGDSRTGYGNNSPIYLTLDGPLSTARLPDPRDSTLDDSPILLIDVDPDSPRLGERVPLMWNLQDTATNYQPANLLAVVPAHGFPLRASTTYAVIVTTDLLRANPRFQDAMEPGTRSHRGFASLIDELPFQGLAKDDLAVATVFTTQDPVEEMAVLARFVRDRIDVQDLDQHVRDVEEGLFFDTYEGRYLGPVFTHGERPYAIEGGGFEFRPDGTPILHSWDSMRMGITVPSDPSQMPEDGWPVVIFQHGTYSDYLAHADNPSGLKAAAQLAKAGWATIGIDLPLHGVRDGPNTITDLHSFNLLNPPSGITNFRQGAIDAIFLARTLAAKPTTFVTERGDEIRLDPEHIAFMGHSQGAMQGDLAVPFMSEWVDGAALSGTGGILSIVVVQRTDVLDFAELVRDLADFDEHELVTPFHPVLGMIQWLADYTDPINYAPHWYSEPVGFEGQRPMPVMLFHGTADTSTPLDTAEALACAARMPQIAPAPSDPPCMTLRGLTPVLPPIAGHVPSWEGTTTAALAQWEDGSHTVVFNEPAMARIYQGFFETLLEGEPVVGPTP